MLFTKSIAEFHAPPIISAAETPASATKDHVALAVSLSVVNPSSDTIISSPNNAIAATAAVMPTINRPIGFVAIATVNAITAFVAVANTASNAGPNATSKVAPSTDKPSATPFMFSPRNDIAFASPAVMPIALFISPKN